MEEDTFPDVGVSKRFVLQLKEDYFDSLTVSYFFLGSYFSALLFLESKMLYGVIT